LHDPTKEPAPSPFSPPVGWNKGLIAIHGAGCPGGWYMQGAAEGVNPLNTARLGEGWALVINTLHHPSNSCNPFLAGEAAMVGKQHFIETCSVRAPTRLICASTATVPPPAAGEPLSRLPRTTLRSPIPPVRDRRFSTLSATSPTWPRQRISRCAPGTTLACNTASARSTPAPS